MKECWDAIGKTTSPQECLPLDSQSSIRIRKFEPRDQSAIVSIHQRAFADIDAIPAGVFDDLNQIETEFMNGGTFLVAEAFPTNAESGDPQIVAVGAIKRLTANLGEVMRMAVDPKFQRRQIASQLLDSLETEALSLGISELVLHTLVQLPSAIQLYEKAGYQFAGNDVMYGNDVVGFRKCL